MKRILSLTLALVMVLGTFTGVFAAEQSVEEFAAEFLAKNDILKGTAEDGDLMLDEGLARRDAVILLSRLLGEEEVAESFITSEESPSWEDARTDAYYVPFFAWAQENGYFEGDDEGNFNPRSAITSQEFALVLLRALGYDAKGYDSWKEALESAKAIGLLEDVEVAFGDEVVRGQMAVMIFNALGTEMNEPAGVTLAEHLGIEMPKPEELEVEKVHADNLKEIKIELNDASLVNVEQAEDARNYRTDAGSVVDAKLDGNTIVLTLEGQMVQNRKYELTTRYIKGLELNKEQFTAYDNQAPAVDKVTVLGTQGIRVRMTEPVKGANEKDFLLNGRNFVMRVKHYGRDILLLPYREDGEFEEGTHELTIGSLEDFAGFKSRSEVHEIEIVEDTTKPEVAKVIARNTSVIVEFENEVHPDSVSKKNVAWSEVRGRKVVEADDFKILAGNKIEYKFGANKELPKPSATISISGLKNYSGYVMDAYEAIHDIEVDFSRPEIVNFKLVSKTKMEIEFSKALDQRTAEDVDNYVLSEYKLSDDEYKVSKYAVDKAELDGKFVTVTFIDGSLKEGNKYRLAVEGVRDNTTLKNTMIADELEFTYGIGQNLEVVAVRERTNEKIVLEFNKDLVRRDAEDLRNYEFELVDESGKFFRASDLSKNPSVYLYGNGRTVEINLPGNARTIDTVHLGSGLTALDGNRLSVTGRIVKLTDSYLDITKATLNKDGDKLTVEFNQDITKAPEASKVALTGTTGTLTVSVVKGNLEITGFTGVPTEVKIDSGSEITTEFEVNEIANLNNLVFDDITDNRGLAVDTLTAELDGNKDLTINIVLNKAIDGKQEEEVDVLINGKIYKSLDKATRLGAGRYQFVVANQDDATTVRVVGLKLNKTVDVVDQAAADLTQAKTDAKANLDAYVDADDYKINATALEDAIVDGKDAIDAATTEADVATAEGDAKVVIDGIDNDEDLLDVEIAKLDVSALEANLDATAADSIATAKALIETDATALVDGDFVVTVASVEDFVAADAGTTDGSIEVILTVTHTATGVAKTAGNFTLTIAQ